MAQLKSTHVIGNLSVTGNVVASKIIKNGEDDTKILLAGGGTKLISDFATDDELNPVAAAASNASQTASEAKSIADEAKGIAGQAKETADAAAEVAESAKTTAETANTTANAAAAAAAAAQGTADAKVDKGGDVMTGNLTMLNTALEFSTGTTADDSTVKAFYQYNSDTDCIELKFN